MDSALSSRRWMESVAATLATAVLLYFGNGLDPLWPLMWFATVPVLLLSLRANGWAAAATAIAAMLLGGLNLWSYYTTALGIPGFVWVVTFLTASVVFAAVVLLFRATRYTPSTPSMMGTLSIPRDT